MSSIALLDSINECWKKLFNYLIGSCDDRVTQVRYTIIVVAYYPCDKILFACFSFEPTLSYAHVVHVD